MNLKWKRFFSLVLVFMVISALANHFWPSMTNSMKDDVRNFLFNNRRIKLFETMLFISYILVGLEGFTKTWRDIRARERFNTHVTRSVNGFFLSGGAFLGMGLGISLESLINEDLQGLYRYSIVTMFLVLILFLPLYMFDTSLRQSENTKLSLSLNFIFILLGSSGLVQMVFKYIT